jgi:hypothetical protein
VTGIRKDSKRRKEEIVAQIIPWNDSSGAENKASLFVSIFTIIGLGKQKMVHVKTKRPATKSNFGLLNVSTCSPTVSSVFVGASRFLFFKTTRWDLFE